MKIDNPASKSTAYNSVSEREPKVCILKSNRYSLQQYSLQQVQPTTVQATTGTAYSLQVQPTAHRYSLQQVYSQVQPTANRYSL